MKRYIRTLLVIMIIAGAFMFQDRALAQRDIWVTAYYAGWMQGWSDNGHLRAAEIDYSAVTHIVHFSLVPRSDGTLNADANSMTPINSQSLVSKAHAAGKKVIICVGGWASDVGFRGATSDVNRGKFIQNLITFMQTRGYDGIDIDWERLESTDAAQYVSFIKELRKTLDSITPRPLLTAAVAWNPAILAQVHSQFDQINIMSYDLSGAWTGWVTWHNSPIYDGGYRFPSTGGAVPSIDGMVNSFIASGIPAAKLGIGIDFYGYVWSGGSGMPNGGATDPRQSWTSAPTVQSNVAYYILMDTYDQSKYYKWDDAAQVSYMSINNSGSAGDKFISYDDEQTSRKKVEYARAKNIGGVIIWELGGGYRPNLPAGQRNPLLQAVKSAVGSGTGLDATPPTIAFTRPAAGSTVSGLLNLSVTASDNVGVVGVQFMANGSNIGTELTVAPYSLTWNSTLVADGPLTLTAVARDAAGNQATATVEVVVANLQIDDTPPVVSFVSPLDGASLTGPVTLKATATDNIAVTGVQFFVNGTALGSEVTFTPYETPWNTDGLSSGTYILTVKARDAAGNTSSATINVAVGGATTPPSKPNVVFDETLQTPWINNSWSATIVFGSTEQAASGTKSIRVSSSAWGALSLHYGPWGSSSGVDPTAYQILRFSIYAPSDGTSLNVFFENDLGQSFPKLSTGALVAGRWNTFSFPMADLNPNRQVIHRISLQELSGSLKVFYVDDLGFEGGPSPQDVTPPVVTVSDPKDGATLSGVVTILVSASDSVGVAGVRLLVDGTLLSEEDATIPYNFSWDTKTVRNGSHTLKAIARDAAGNEASAFVSVTVANEQEIPSPTATGRIIFDDSLHSPWINASWNAVITFGSPDRAAEGSRSIRVDQNAWGAFRVHNGAWGSPLAVPGSPTTLDFKVFGGSVGVSLAIFLENDLNEPFPALKYQWVNAQQWKEFSIPLSALNPQGQVVHRVVIQDLSGRQRTFYIDALRFVGGTGSIASTTEFTTDGSNTLASRTISQNYPNPFNPTTTISYTLPFDAKVTLEVYNGIGQRVALLVNETKLQGSHVAIFDARGLASGMYYYRLLAMPTAGNTQQILEIRRMVLLK